MFICIVHEVVGAVACNVSDTNERRTAAKYRTTGNKSGKIVTREIEQMSPGSGSAQCEKLAFL